MDDTTSELLRRQSGRIGLWQLLQAGMTPAEAKWAIRSRGLHIGRRGVARDPDAQTGHEGDVWEAVLACLARRDRELEGAAADIDEVHEAAAGAIGATGLSALWGFGVIEQPPSNPQLLLPHDLQRAVPGVETVRTRVWTGAIALARGMPAVDIVRALWDTAWILRREPGTPARLTAFIGRADGLRLLRAEELWHVACNPASYGLPTQVPDAFRIAAFRSARMHSHSGSEHRARLLIADVCAALGIEAEPRPHDVPVAGGRLIEVDVALPAVRIAIEIDGPHHDDPSQQRWDQRRDAWLRAAGWIVLRYPADLVDASPAAFRAQVEADLAAALAMRTAA